MARATGATARAGFARRHERCSCGITVTARSFFTALALGLASIVASAAPRDTPGACPGYLAHLRSARACLARGDRRAAAAELRQAEQALDSCLRGAAGNRAVAGLEPAPWAS
jgi:hypothetical protein